VRRKFPAHTCERCGKSISERADGSGLRAHKCEHGNECVAPSSIHPHDGRTHGVPCSQCTRLPDAAKLQHASSLEQGVMDLAFCIEDPCPASAITLARALIDFGRAIPEGKRDDVVAVIGQLTRILMK
jgi:hypothetical protein